MLRVAQFTVRRVQRGPHPPSGTVNAASIGHRLEGVKSSSSPVSATPSHPLLSSLGLFSQRQALSLPGNHSSLQVRHLRNKPATAKSAPADGSSNGRPVLMTPSAPAIELEMGQTGKAGKRKEAYHGEDMPSKVRYEPAAAGVQRGGRAAEGSRGEVKRAAEEKRASAPAAKAAPSEAEQWWSGSTVLRSRDNPYLPMAMKSSRSPLSPPEELLKALDSILKGRNTPMLSQHWEDMLNSLKERNISLMKSVKAVQKLEEALKLGTLQELPKNAANTDSPPLLYGPTETLAYALHKLLPSFSIASRIFSDIQQSTPLFQPRSMLDFGSGPGSAIAAAREAWPESLHDIVAVEQSRSMSQVSEHLLSSLSLPGIMYRRSLADVARLHKGKKYDLIVSHFTMSELCTDKDRDAAVAELWDLLNPGGMLVLSENGDRWGFRVLQRTRDMLLERAAALARFLPQLQSDKLALGGGSSVGLKQRLAGRGAEGELPPGIAALQEGGSSEEGAEEEGEEEGQQQKEGGSIYQRLQRAHSKEGAAGAAGAASAAASDAGARSSTPSTAGLDIASLSMEGFEEAPAEAVKQVKEGAVTAAAGAGAAGDSSSSADLSLAGNKSLLYPSKTGSRPPLPTAQAVKQHLKEFLRRNSNRLRPPADTHGMAVVGPCPHASSCPMHASSWCFFGQRVHRHRRAGTPVHNRNLPSHLEHYSWVAFRKTTPSIAEREHAPSTRAGYRGTGVWAYDASVTGEQRAEAQAAELAKLDAEKERLEDEQDSSMTAAQREAREKERQRIIAAAAAIATGKDGRGTIGLSQRNLEPERWWLTRPGSSEWLQKQQEGSAEDGGKSAGLLTGGSSRKAGGLGVSWEDEVEEDEDAAARRTALAHIRSGLPGQPMSPSGLSPLPFLSSGREAGKKKTRAVFGEPEPDSKYAPLGLKPGRGGALAGLQRSDEEEDGSGSEGEDSDEEEDVTQDAEAAAALERITAAAIEDKLPGAGQWARILRPALKRSKHVILDVCTPQGTMERRIATKGKLKGYPGAYRAARKAGWGGQWPNWLSRKRVKTELPAGERGMAALEEDEKEATLLLEEGDKQQQQQQQARRVQRAEAEHLPAAEGRRAAAAASAGVAAAGLPAAGAAPAAARVLEGEFIDPQEKAKAAAAVASALDGSDAEGEGEGEGEGEAGPAYKRPSRKARRKAALQHAYQDWVLPEEEEKSQRAMAAGPEEWDPAGLVSNTGPAGSMQRGAAAGGLLAKAARAPGGVAQKIDASALFSKKSPELAQKTRQAAMPAVQRLQRQQPINRAGEQAGMGEDASEADFSSDVGRGSDFGAGSAAAGGRVSNSARQGRLSRRGRGAAGRGAGAGGEDSD